MSAAPDAHHAGQHRGIEEIKGPVRRVGEVCDVQLDPLRPAHRWRARAQHGGGRLGGIPDLQARAVADLVAGQP